MSGAKERLHVRCLEVLQAHLDSGGEPALHAAYEVGRGALEDGLGILDLIGAVHAALVSSVLASDEHQALRVLARSEPFLLECFSPFEMAHRGTRDTNAALRRINETREADIQRLARELHDEAGQMLVAVHLALDALAPHVDPAAHELMDRARTGLREADAQLRRISHEMRPSLLDDLGLVPALRHLADGVARRTGLSVRVDGTTGGRLAPPVELAIYRVAQEALNNAARHAHAREVMLRVVRGRERLEFAITDDGCGFDPDRVVADGRERGLGLLGIRERLGPLGGTLEILSASSGGTELRVKIPMKGSTRVTHPAG
jgi:signal transduction histidine kinase